MSDKKDRGEPRRLTVTRVGKEITSGTGKNGPWALNEVFALDASGNEIDQSLKSFADLTPLLGVLTDYYVEKDERESNGRVYVSYLLTPKISGTALKLEALTLRVTALEQQLARLQGTPPPDYSPAVAPQAAAASSSPATRDDDIPF